MLLFPAFISSSGAEYVGRSGIQVYIHIQPGNDRPKKGPAPYIRVPDLPYKKSEIDTRGFKVSSIMNQKDTVGKKTVVRSAFKDEDGDKIGKLQFYVDKIRVKKYWR